MGVAVTLASHGKQTAVRSEAVRQTRYALVTVLYRMVGRGRARRRRRSTGTNGVRSAARQAKAVRVQPAEPACQC